MAETTPVLTTINVTEEGSGSGEDIEEDEVAEKYKTIVIIQVTYLCFVFLVGSVSNLIVIFRAMRYRNGLLSSGSYQKVKIDSTNMFVISLALANLGTSTFSVGIYVLPTYLKNAAINDFTCSFIWPLRELFLAVACFSFTLIAVGRCFILFKSFKDRRIFRYPVVNNVALWLICYLVFCLPFAAAYRPVQLNELWLCDTVNWPSRKIERTYITFVVVLHVALPVLLVGISYIGIIARLKRVAHVVAPLSTMKIDNQNEEVLTTVMKSHRAVKISILLLLSFTITFMPYGIFVLYVRYNEVTADIAPIIEHIQAVAFCLLHSGAILDPLVLMLSSRGYRPNLRALKNCFQS